ncbi:MAG: metal-dependent hydrolase [Caldisericum sp.]|jgi:inner membrane protein|nr:metal-dependent hydrolase [Caldisericum sp.]
MTGRTHIAASISLVSVLPPTPATITGLFIGAILPDIDVEGATITRYLPRIPVEHRTITHSILALAVVMFFANIVSTQFGVGMAMGYLSHLVLDAMTPTGVPLLYPFNKKRHFRFPLTIHTGSTMELMFFVVLVIIDVFVYKSVLTKIL